MKIPVYALEWGARVFVRVRLCESVHMRNLLFVRVRRMLGGWWVVRMTRERERGDDDDGDDGVLCIV